MCIHIFPVRCVDRVLLVFVMILQPCADEIKAIPSYLKIDNLKLRLVIKQKLFFVCFLGNMATWHKFTTQDHMTILLSRSIA